MNEKQKIGFDSKKYIKLQSENIKKRIKKFSKLYMEIGGKIFDDLHAQRVLPGFAPDTKVQILETLKDDLEIIICVSANDIERNRVRDDLGLSYADEVLRLADNLRSRQLNVSSFVVTMFKGQPSAEKFGMKLQSRGETVYFHSYTKGYPKDVDTIVSDEGYGANPYIKTTKSLVVVTAPGASSGKLATCLSQLYHEYKLGHNAGYAKYETFPVWDLPLKSAVNIAYEAATADIHDINEIDPYHFNAYGILSVNYNRDIEVFPIVDNILQKIMGKKIYKSPTDMGVNMISKAIIDNEIIEDAAKKEIVRRYYRAECDYKKGKISQDNLDRNRVLLHDAGITPSYLKPTVIAKHASKESGYPCVALMLDDTNYVVGKNKKIVSAAGAVILNALRTLSNLGDDFDVISDEILMPIVKLRTEILKYESGVLSVNDILIALSICSTTNNKAKKALSVIDKLKGLDAHATYILRDSEEQTLKKLGINITCEPQYLDNKLFHE